MYYQKNRKGPWQKFGILALIITIGFLAGYGGNALYQKWFSDSPVEGPPSAPTIDLETRAAPEAGGALRAPEVQPSAVPEKPGTPAAPAVPKDVKKDQLWLHVHKGAYRMDMFKGDALVKSYKIAVGANGGQKQRVGDSRTPIGTFSVQQIQNSTSWTYDFGDGNGQTRGAYGPWFIRLKTPGWTGIGIHGTHDPRSLGTMITQGCIRMNNAELGELKKQVFLGMKVVISE